MRSPAHDSEELSRFAIAIYNLFFEKTTGPKDVKAVASDGKTVVEVQRFKPLELLPKQFRRKRFIIRAVDAIRHHFGKAHITDLDTFNATGSGISVAEVLMQYLGSKAIPRNEGFLALQLAVLKDSKQYLEELRLYFEQKESKSQEESL